MDIRLDSRRAIQAGPLVTTGRIAGAALRMARPFLGIARRLQFKAKAFELALRSVALQLMNDAMADADEAMEETEEDADALGGPRQEVRAVSDGTIVTEREMTCPQNRYCHECSWTGAAAGQNVAAKGAGAAVPGPNRRTGSGERRGYG
uniref:Nodulation protein NolJ n=1 Tax=Rhizobium fredii TaxID=380 RepID=NOLJ_RHIFR|nr:RecName: Full=Nodulation protein NolJ; AltName: Full=Host-inducible protein B [Sinorhizobium fredii]AAA26295.1 inducible protein B [Sinorhizobium fredii]AAA26344.1 nodulation protein [Sinorhizobium fredii]